MGLRLLARVSKGCAASRFFIVADSVTRWSEVDGNGFPEVMKVQTMYTLLNSVRPKPALISELPGFISALVIAQLLFKFGSFSLELLGFLAVWVSISFLQASLIGVFSKPSSPVRDTESSD